MFCLTYVFCNVVLELSHHSEHSGIVIWTIHDVWTRIHQKDNEAVQKEIIKIKRSSLDKQLTSMCAHKWSLPFTWCCGTYITVVKLVLFQRIPESNPLECTLILSHGEIYKHFGNFVLNFASSTFYTFMFHLDVDFHDIILLPSIHYHRTSCFSWKYLSCLCTISMRINLQIMLCLVSKISSVWMRWNDHRGINL